MADKERAKKLAAAKKKLKAYKSGEKQINEKINNVEDKTTDAPILQSYFSNKDNTSDLFLSEEKESPNMISNTIIDEHRDQSPATPEQNFITTNELIIKKSFPENNTNENTAPVVIHFEKETNEGIDKINSLANSSELLKTIEVLISEKAHLSKETSKLQISCKEKDFEIEEIRTRLNGSNKRIEELEQFYFNEQRKNSGTSERMQFLEIELNKYKIQCEEFSDHVEELKRELSVDKARIIEMEKENKEKDSQIQLNNVRINQISDENNITIDNRIEILTQKKFMYEQQIVDLQNMVQQLRAEKDQANQQYQNYVQHLNKDLSSLSEKNSELSDENTKLAARERELVDHISNLEKEIQQNITKNEQLRQNMKNTSPDNEKTEIHEDNFKIQIEELKRSENELKKTIEEKLQTIIQNEKIIEEKTQEILLLHERFTNLESERPNDAKLLASIESDKVAASRAMTQNSELRKQLDELQLKLIELTNDKMDLTNTLDSERFASKQSRQSFDEMQNQIKHLSEQLHFKDEEMIRLSHENNELGDKLTELQKINDHLQVSRKPENIISSSDNEENIEKLKLFEDPSCNIEGNTKENFVRRQLSESTSENGLQRKNSDTISLPTSEAVWRLEERFKRLMGEVADLTDEKQQLEHLVLKLQCETETIGEYIALYQSQRKILKQKENERDAQLKRLLDEREDLRNKALQLDDLIREIGLKSNDTLSSSLIEINNKEKIIDRNDSSITELDNTNITNGHNENRAQEELNYINNQKMHLNQHQSQNNYNKICKHNQQNINISGGNLTESDSQKIIDRIQALVSDLKQNKDNLPLSTPSVDHCACCSGKFETI